MAQNRPMVCHLITHESGFYLWHLWNLREEVLLAELTDTRNLDHVRLLIMIYVIKSRKPPNVESVLRNTWFYLYISCPINSVRQTFES